METSDQLYTPAASHLRKSLVPNEKIYAGPRVNVGNTSEKNISLAVPGIKLWILGCRTYTNYTTPAHNL